MSKVSKMRPCPALGRSITSADCGEQRNSRITCTEDCPFNPLAHANYPQLLDIEDRVDAATMMRLSETTPDRPSLTEQIMKAERKGSVSLHSFFAWNLFFAQGPDKMTFAQRWQQTDFPGLKNDERVLFLAKTQTRVALIEIHRVLDGERLEAEDLLSPAAAPMLFRDLSLAGRATRFSTLLAWIFPLPHYWRISGVATFIPNVADFTARQIIAEIVRHRGGPLAELEMRRWLAENFVRIEEALSAVSRLRCRQTMASMDLKWGKALYELRASFAQCRERLDAGPGVTLEQPSAAEKDEGFADARNWFETAPELQPPGLMAEGRPVLGRVLLGQTFWRLEAFGSGKLARLRQLFEEACGDAVKFTSERVDDLHDTIPDKAEAADKLLAPPRLLENPTQLQITSQRLPNFPQTLSKEDVERQLFLEHDKAFLDDLIPALDNRSPRQAALDALLRPKLVELMKKRIRKQDEDNLRTGQKVDVNWMVRELGLNEILFDPPPWRPPPPDLPEEASDEADFDDSFAVDPNRPAAPPLPREPLELPEASVRLKNVFKEFPTAEAAEDELLDSGATLLDDASAITLEDLTEEEFETAIPFLFQAWFALVPKGCRAPEIVYEELENAYLENRHQVARANLSNLDHLEEFLTTGPQSALTMILLGEVLHGANKGPGKDRLPIESQLAILALLKSVIQVLHESLAEP